MITTDPINNLYGFVAYGLLATFSAASQHVLLLAYQMETLHLRDWGVGEGMGVFAYRMAILTGGSGALALATYLPWKEVYLLITCLMFIGLIAVLIGGEIESASTPVFTRKRDWLHYAIIAPFKDFMSQKGWLAILVFMLIYRLPENLMSMMQTLFLLDLGFTKIEVSFVAKTFGMGAIIAGGLMGGYWIRQYGYKKTLLWGAIAHGFACLLFLVQERLGANLPFLYVTIGVEHFCGGIMLTGFFSYQLICSNKTFAATQLALLTSFANLGALLPKSFSGVVIDHFGWTVYLVIVVIACIPGILWVYRIPLPSEK